MLRRVMAVSAILCAALHPARADTVILTADVWCPHNCEAGGGREGYVVDLVREILKRDGDTVEYRVRPWARALRETEAGLADAVIGVTGEALEARAARTGPVGTIEYVFATRPDSRWSWRSVESLAGRRFAAGDYAFSPEIDAFIAAHPGDVFVSRGDRPLVASLRRLDIGDVDAVLDDRAVLEDQARRLDLSIRIAGGMPRIPLRLAFMAGDPRSEGRARRIDRGVARLRASGDLARILAPYGVADWDSPILTP